MKDIDKILKDAVQGYEASYNSSAWDNISSKLSPMEDAFRGSVEGYEVPYSPAAWSAIKGSIGTSSIFVKWIAGSAAALGLVFGAYFLLPIDKNSTENSSYQTNTNSTNTVLATSNTNSESETNPIATIENNSDDNTMELGQNTNSANEETILAEDIPSGDIGETNENSNSQTDISLSLGTTTIPLYRSDEEEDVLGNSKEEVNTESISNVNADFSSSNTSICLGETFLLNPKVEDFSITHIWNFGDGTTSNQSATSHKYTMAGSFEITHSIIDKGTDKILAVSSQIIAVKELPNVNYTWNKNSDQIPTLIFSSNLTNTNTINWKINEHMISDQNNFEHTFRDKGVYNIELYAENENGCTNSETNQIFIKENYNLLAPKAFTPNGDYLNDTFMPLALEIVESEFTLSIFNQEGEMIYQTNDANSPWGGVNANDNSIVKSGAYIWGVVLKNGNGVFENYKGQVFIIR